MGRAFEFEKPENERWKPWLKPARIGKDIVMAVKDGDRSCQLHFLLYKMPRR